MAQAPLPVYARGGALEASGAPVEGGGVMNMVAGVGEGYERAGIFPWGKRGQKVGPCR
jgi:hypothetical protein